LCHHRYRLRAGGRAATREHARRDQRQAEKTRPSIHARKTRVSNELWVRQRDVGVQFSSLLLRAQRLRPGCGLRRPSNWSRSARLAHVEALPWEAKCADCTTHSTCTAAGRNYSWTLACPIVTTRSVGTRVPG
jgi:hypothetical protein